MPTRVRRARRPTRTCKYEIVETGTNVVKGCSNTRRNAETSSAIRNRAEREKRRR